MKHANLVVGLAFLIVILALIAVSAGFFWPQAGAPFTFINLRGLIITAETISQLLAGVMFTPAEIIGPISGFAVLGLFALWVLWILLHNTAEPAPQVGLPFHPAKE